MKKNLLLFTSLILVVVALIVIGNILVIGEKLAQASHLWFMEYVFYALISLLFAYLLLVPLWRMYRMPEFPVFDKDLLQDAEDKTLHDFAARLYKTSAHPDKQGPLDQQTNRELSAFIISEIDERMARADLKMHAYAGRVFIATAVSQNGALDTLIVMFLNLKMIYDMVKATGFRPNVKELSLLYMRVMFVSLFSYVVSGTLSGIEDFDVDFVDFGDSVDDMDPASIFNKLKIPGIVSKSVVDGVFNTLLCYRVGYVTRSYLQQGPKAFKNKAGVKHIRQSAIRNSIVQTLSLLKDKVPSLTSSALSQLERFMVRGFSKDVRPNTPKV